MGAPVQLLSTARGSFCFGVLFYEAPVWKCCKALVCYSNTTHHVGVYGVHGVWCANVLCALVLSLVRSTSAMLNDKHTERKTSTNPSACQPPLVTSARNGCLGYFYEGFLKKINLRVFFL